MEDAWRTNSSDGSDPGDWFAEGFFYEKLAPASIALNDAACCVTS